ncbi:MAG: HhH-GPD-type base excision DNA repair protein [Gaiellaceae bacterium]
MPERLYFTGDDEANALIARDPLALLVGFVLDQQVTVQKAFSGPLELQRRLGSLDAAAIAGMDRGALERIFAEKPAIHRLPGSMAGRVQDFCAAIASEYGGRTERVWTDAADADDLKRRLLALPGIGAMKATTIAGVLAKRFGVEVAKPLVSDRRTLGDVDSAEALDEYQAAKRAHKAALRAARA